MALSSWGFYPGPKTNLPTLSTIAGSLVAHSSAPTVNTGKNFTVSKVATGIYRVTFNRKVGHIVSAVGTLRKSAGAATFLTGPLWADANNYVDFRVENASGTAANAADTDVIDFNIQVMLEKQPVK